MQTENVQENKTWETMLTKNVEETVVFGKYFKLFIKQEKEL